MNMKNRKTTETMEEAASSLTENATNAFATVNTSLIRAIDRNRTIVQNWMRAIQEESLRFMNMQLEHATQAIERSRECEDISALITLQHDWLMDIARDYADLNKRFGDVLHELTEHGADSVHDVTPGAALVGKVETVSERAVA